MELELSIADSTLHATPTPPNLDYSAILEELSDTVCNSSDDFRVADQDVVKDISANRIFEPVKPKKRSGKGKELLEEEFSYTVYKIKQTGFTTMRPKVWAIALEHYAQTDSEVTYRWMNKTNEEEKITHAKIYIWYRNTSQLTISINFIQGLVTVSGDTFKRWIEEEFSKVTRNMDECIQQKFTKSIESLRGPLSNDSENKDSPPAKNSQKDTDASTNNTQKEIDALGDECKDIRNSLKSIDNSNLEITNRINELVNDLKRLESETNGREKMLDVKITEFTIAIEKEIEKRIASRVKALESNHHNLRTEFAKFREHITEKTEELLSLPLDEIKNLPGETSKLNERVSAMDFKGLSESYVIDRDNHDIDFQTQKNRLAELQEQFEEYVLAQESYRQQQARKQVEYEQETQKLQQSIAEMSTERHNNNNNNNNNNNSNHNSNNNTNNRNSNDVDIIMCIDSNRKFINFRKLWTLKGTKRRRSGNLASVKMAIEREKATNVKYFLISVGTNDIDEKDPSSILDEYVEIVELLRRKYPAISIIINQLPPRKLRHDDKVQAMNQLLTEMCHGKDFLYLVNQDGLRSDVDRNMYDDKHIHRRAVYIFAGNIKRTLRKAYGIPEPQRDDAIRIP